MKSLTYPMPHRILNPTKRQIEKAVSNVFDIAKTNGHTSVKLESSNSKIWILFVSSDKWILVRYWDLDTIPRSQEEVVWLILKWYKDNG